MPKRKPVECWVVTDGHGSYYCGASEERAWTSAGDSRFWRICQNAGWRNRDEWIAWAKGCGWLCVKVREVVDAEA